MNDRCTTTAHADVALKNGPKSPCAEIHIPVSRHFSTCLGFTSGVVQRSL